MRPIRVGHIDLSFHDASAREVEKILEDFGHRVQRYTASHEVMFSMLGSDQEDMLVSAWLPASHQKYLTPMEHVVRKLTVLYKPFCIWGVPEHIPAEEVRAVGDLLKPEVLEKMSRRIQGINPGAGISRFSVKMIDAYRLGDAGYYFRPGTETECFGRFEEAVNSGEWIVIPLWHPQFLHHRFQIRALEEPEGLLGGTDKATLLTRKSSEMFIGEKALKALKQLYLGNERVSELDDLLQSKDSS
ncbi:glycine betaine ABC transporter substrate-binding protein [Microbulbifer echini]